MRCALLNQRWNGFPANLRPFARAGVRGDASHAALAGAVDFFSWRGGIVIMAELWGLPYSSEPCAANICALHIHAGGDCGSADTAFSGAGEHYNPHGCPHPAHAGDLPPLLVSRGYAWQACYTERFTPEEIIGKTVVIHSQRDDFTSQPTGDAGDRIGCGVIQARR